jgi:hypothetical protein
VGAERSPGLPDVGTAYVLRILAHRLDSRLTGAHLVLVLQGELHAGQKVRKDTTGTNQPQNGIGPPPREKPMTDTPDDLPSPDEFRRKMAHVDQEFADARRYLSALCAQDNQGLGALMAEIHRSGRAMSVLAAMAVQALDFAHLSADRLGGDVQKWLDESVVAPDTAETERDQTELGGEG